MKTMTFATVVLGLTAAACGDAHDPPLVYQQTDSSWVPTLPVAGNPINLGAEQTLVVEGHLEGTLRGIALSGDTTDNNGYYAKYDEGTASLNASIATRGDGGAGMLIINLTLPELRQWLMNGQWSSTGELEPGPLGGTSVSSCAGPTVGEWPYEIGSSDADMEATEDPERPGIVVLSVTAHFPRSESDSSSTTELAGTLRFPLPDAD